MDLLKAEILKRKASENDSNRPSKYMRRGEIEQLKAEKEQEKAKVEVEKPKVCPIRLDSVHPLREKQTPQPTRSMTPHTPEPSTSDKPETSGFNISNEEVIRRLRQKGQPIRLFGESDKDRRLRLRALELIEERGGDKGSGQNDFRKALEDVELGERRLAEGGSKGKSKEGEDKSKSKGDEPVTILDLKLLKTDKDKVYPLIYFALKKTLKDWEQALEERPGQRSLVFTSLGLLITLRRRSQDDEQGQTCSRYPSPISRVPQAAL